MPDFDAIIQQATLFGPVVLVTLSVFLAAEAILLGIANRRRVKREINSRLETTGKATNRQEALIELRRNRGLTSEGHYRLPIVAFNRLLLQSGVRTRPGSLALIMFAAATVAALVVYFLTRDPLLTVAVAAFAGGLLPVMFLAFARSRRTAKFEGQLPEAIEVMVRSLRAGHPIPVAISLVARELPDPVGSEFGMVSDEMTYGLALDTAMENMRNRTGQSDLSMLVVAVSIQSRTGGNLAEILSNISRLIRERFRMRRKIHAMSAEGRFSAIALSVIPVVLAVVINLIAPGYFGEVKDHPAFWPSMYFGVALWVVGMYVMRRMTNFKF